MPKYCNVDNLKHAIHAFANKYGIIGMSITDFNIMLERNRVDVEPVRHGHWCVTQAYPHTIYCSECFQRFAQAHWAVWEDGSLPRDYCPNCGAKMDGERREDG